MAGLLGSRMGGKKRDLTLEFLKWLPNEKTAWEWLGREVRKSPSGGELLFRPSKLGSFRCGKTGEIVSLRERTVLEGRVPLRKWLLALLLIAEREGRPGCEELAGQLARVSVPVSGRGTSPPGGARMLSSIMAAPVSDLPWWKAVEQSAGNVIPFALVRALSRRFLKRSPAPGDWKVWISRRRRQPVKKAGKTAVRTPRSDNVADPYFKYLFITKVRDIGVEKKLQEHGKWSAAATWFTLPGLREAPLEYWNYRPTGNSRHHSRKLLSENPDKSIPSKHLREDEVGMLVDRYDLEREIPREDVLTARRLEGSIAAGSARPAKVAIIHRFTLSGEDHKGSDVAGSYVIRAALPDRPVYFFCSRGDPGQNAYDRLLADLARLEGGPLKVLTRCVRFRKTIGSQNLGVDLEIIE